MTSTNETDDARREYDTAIGGFYDAYFTGVEGDTAFYVARARAAGSPVLELGCGSGRILIPTARAGLDVVGLDRSPAMLDLARERVAALPPAARRRIKLVEGDMADFALRRRFALITLPYRAFQHLLTPEDQVRALLCIRGHLRRGGRLAFNLYDPSAELARAGGSAGLRRDEDFIDPRTGRRVAAWYSRRYDPVAQLMRQEYVFDELDADGTVARRSYHPLTMRYTYRAEMQYLLELCGYTIESLSGDFEGGPYRGAEQVWVAARGAGS
jgi:SAM-dependent methyltransferase